MSQLFDIGIFGGDLRQVYMAASFLSKGYRVATYSLSEKVKSYVDWHDSGTTMQNHYPQLTLSELFDHCKILIGPIPMTRDQINITSVNTPTDLTIAHVAYLLRENHILIGGAIPAPLIDRCRTKHIPCYDLLQDEKITILNAIATAEGALMEAIRESDRNLHDSNCLVLGYGRCGKVLAQKLKALDAHVTVAVRSRDALAYAAAAGLRSITISAMSSLLPSFQFIFNTIPSLILDQNNLSLVHPQAVIIDISSAPGGVDFNYASSIKLKAKLCLGIPGKISPRTSSDILVTEIIAFLKERSD
jgi:dipicolinate synthase subunit A